jgi:outer membrane protein OmpA-like peptidoglycan-associated protein
VQSKKTFVAVLLIVAASVVSISANAAELGWLRLTLTGSAGYATLDDSLQIDDGIPLEARAGVEIFKYVGLEGSFGKILADSDRDPERDYPADLISADLLINFLPKHRVNPYILGGWTEIRTDEDDGSRVDMNGWEYGAGLKIALTRKPGARIDLRLEGRDRVVKIDAPLDGAGETAHNYFVTGAIHFAFFGQEKDSDRDGVSDGPDKCPNTPYGAAVDSKGCPIDSDGDGVYDGLDLCAKTPKGAIVDARGCPIDTDGDGVYNGVDLCEGTPAGAVVDSIGCPIDSDGDGVPDGLDNCPNTPAGIGVDDFGCPKDSDGDGVLDGIDQCEGTPLGVTVDEVGCPVPINEMEKELVDTGVIQLHNIYFDTGKATLKAASHQVLHDVAAILVKWPSLKIEIGGHADATGPDDMNLELSRQRAHSVLDFLIDNFDELQFSQFFVRGYGETQPIASNDTVEGRRTNRRVEFKVLNRENLPNK